MRGFLIIGQRAAPRYRLTWFCRSCEVEHYEDGDAEDMTQYVDVLISIYGTQKLSIAQIFAEPNEAITEHEIAKNPVTASSLDELIKRFHHGDKS